MDGTRKDAIGCSIQAEGASTSSRRHNRGSVQAWGHDVRVIGSRSLAYLDLLDVGVELPQILLQILLRHSQPGPARPGLSVEHLGQDPLHLRHLVYSLRPHANTTAMSGTSSARHPTHVTSRDRIPSSPSPLQHQQASQQTQSPESKTT